MDPAFKVYSREGIYSNRSEWEWDLGVRIRWESRRLANSLRERLTLLFIHGLLGALPLNFPTCSSFRHRLT